jgi:hypothetical protein
VETHQAVFLWVLELLAEKDLLKGKTIGIDATTLEANAALRSIVRRETGEGYQEFLTRLAQESGIATPTREQLAKLDRKRTGKGPNENRGRRCWKDKPEARQAVYGNRRRIRGEHEKNCCGDGESCWNAALHMPMRRVACGARTCGAEKIFSSVP